jgi:AmiR/NasT family two-component response regulator
VSDNGHNGRVDVDRLGSIVEELRVRNGQLERALGSRIVIEQAKGVLVERYALDVETAFVLLRRAARSSRVRIHDLAREIVASRVSPEAIELERPKVLS